jgi:hypothetical protein
VRTAGEEASNGESSETSLSLRLVTSGIAAIVALFFVLRTTWIGNEGVWIYAPKGYIDRYLMASVVFGKAQDKISNKQTRQAGRFLRRMRRCGYGPYVELAMMGVDLEHFNIARSLTFFLSLTGTHVNMWRTPRPANIHICVRRKKKKK